jgi:hypothetical protein
MRTRDISIMREQFKAKWIRVLNSVLQSRFCWHYNDNNPLTQTLNMRYFQNALAMDGFAVFFYNESSNSLLSTRFCSSYFNIYGEPVKGNCYTDWGFTKNLTDIKDFCFCRNAYPYGINNILDIKLYAEQLAEIDVTRYSIARKLKQPYIFNTNDKDLLNNEIIADQIQNFDVLFIDPEKDINGSEKPFADVLNLNINASSLKDLQDYKETIIKDFYLTLGIKDVEEKRERLLTDEINYNCEKYDIFQYQYIKPRLDFCKEVNDKWNINLECKVVQGVDWTDINDSNYEIDME